MSDSANNQSFTAASWGPAVDNDDAMPHEEGFRSFFPGNDHEDATEAFVPSFISSEKAEAISNLNNKSQDVEETEPPEDMEALKQKAYDDAFAKGQAEGLQDGQRQAREMIERLQNIAVNMETAWASLIETHESRLIELVARAVEKVVYGQAATEHDMVKKAILEALRVVPEPVNVQIAVNPKDYEFIDTVKKDFFSHIKALKDVSVTPDPAIHQGGCNVRTRFGEVDATLENRLEAIRECLLKVNGKKVGNE